MIQQIVLNRTAVVETTFVSGATSCTVTIYDGDGQGRVTDAACSIDTTSTTLTTDADPGDTTLGITTTSGMVIGRRYLLGGTSESKEAFTVRSLTTVSAELVAPLIYDHAVGAPIVGTRAWYNTTVGDAGRMFWDGYAVFQPVDGSREQTESVDCVRRAIPANLIDETDVRKIIPKDMNALSAEFDYRQGLIDARDQYLIELGGKNRASTILGVDYHRRPCSLLFWLMRRAEFGPEWANTFDEMQKEFDRLKDKIISTAPVDADQDGATNGANDRGWTVISVERC